MIKNRRGKKAKFLKELEETPLVTRVCQKLGISRATFYRWCAEDADFAREVAVAVNKGRDRMNDFAESKLIENIQANDYRAIAYWLSHNKKLYRPPTIRVYADENSRQKADLEVLQGLFDELMNHVGLDAAMQLAGFDPEIFRAKVRKELEEQRNRSDEL